MASKKSMNLVARTIRQAQATSSAGKAAALARQKAIESVRSTYRALESIVEEHNRQRDEELQKIWKNLGLAWCSLGEHEAPQDEVETLHFVYQATGGGREYVYEYEYIAQELETACGRCRKKDKRPFNIVSGEMDLDCSNRNEDNRENWPEEIYAKYELPGKARLRVERYRGGRLEDLDWFQEMRGEIPIEDLRLVIGDDPINL